MKRNVITTIIIAALALLAGTLLGYRLQPRQEQVAEKVRVHTVYYAKPMPSRISTERYAITVPRLLFVPSDTVKVVQTVVVADAGDSVTLDVAIEHREYSDSTYRAVVSGPVVGDVHPTLDFMETYNQTTTIITERKQRFALTASAGTIYTPKGFRPNLSLGARLYIKPRFSIEARGGCTSTMTNSTMRAMPYVAVEAKFDILKF